SVGRVPRSRSRESKPAGATPPTRTCRCTTASPGGGRRPATSHGRHSARSQRTARRAMPSRGPPTCCGRRDYWTDGAMCDEAAEFLHEQDEQVEGEEADNDHFEPEHPAVVQVAAGQGVEPGEFL